MQSLITESYPLTFEYVFPTLEHEIMLKKTSIFIKILSKTNKFCHIRRNNYCGINK